MLGVGASCQGPGFERVTGGEPGQVASHHVWEGHDEGGTACMDETMVMVKATAMTMAMAS